MTPPLEGMRILDFTYLLPGPFGTMMLADLGADIIKVENPLAPDLLRLAPPYVEGMSAVYAQVNRGKRSLALNLSFPESVDVVRRLVSEYDVVVEQFRPGVMEKFGLGFGALREVNPSLIYCSLSGYGQTGTYARRAGHDINYMALSGIDSYSGRKEGGPVPGGIQVADLGSGSKNLCIALLAAYIRRLKTGEGDCIDISITDGTFAMSVFLGAGVLAGGEGPLPEGEILNGGSLYDYYRTADGKFLSAGPIEPKFLTAFLETIGMGDVLRQGLLSPEEVLSLKKEIARTISSRPLAHWVDAFSRIDACVEPVRTLSEALTSPPISERDMIVTVRSREGGSFRQIGNPLKFASGNWCAGFAGSSQGFDTDDILRRAGFGMEDIDALRKKGAVA